MTPLERMERLRDQASQRGDEWEAVEMQKMIDEFKAAIRCTCGAIIALEVLPNATGWSEVWTALDSGLHFTSSGFPLMERHWPSYERVGEVK